MNWSLILNILLMYGILVLVNVPAPFLGLAFENDSDTTRRLWYQPPGYVIPIVWFVLFTLLGIGRYTLLQNGAEGYDLLIIALAVLCATYAYYTLGLAQLTGVSALWYGLFGNLLVIMCALFVAYKLFPLSQTTAFLVLPVAVWTLFATAIVLGEMRLEKLI